MRAQGDVGEMAFPEGEDMRRNAAYPHLLCVNLAVTTSSRHQDEVCLGDGVRAHAIDAKEEDGALH